MVHHTTEEMEERHKEGDKRRLPPRQRLQVSRGPGSPSGHSSLWTLVPHAEEPVHRLSEERQRRDVVLHRVRHLVPEQPDVLGAALHGAGGAQLLQTPPGGRGHRGRGGARDSGGRCGREGFGWRGGGGPAGGRRGRRATGETPSAAVLLVSTAARPFDDVVSRKSKTR